MTKLPRLKNLSPGLLAGLLAVCTLWTLVSQVPVWPPFSKAPTLYGPDGLLSWLESRTIDDRIQRRGELPVPLKLIYVDVDTSSIEAIGNFPWKRTRFANAIDALFDYGGIKAVGLDFVFSNEGIPDLGREEAAQGSIDLGRSVYKHEKVVLAATYRTVKEAGITGKNVVFPYLFLGRQASQTDLPTIPQLRGNGGKIGLIDVYANDRLIPFFAQTEFINYYPLSLQLALAYWGLDTSALQIESNQIVVRDPQGRVISKIPLVAHQLLETNWFVPWNTKQTPHKSIADVILAGQWMKEGTPEQRKDAEEFFALFKDAMVLIGPTDPLLGDTSRTAIDPLNPVPRVSIHGNVLMTLISGNYLRRPPPWTNAIMIFALGLMAASLSAQHQKWSIQRKVLAAGLVLAYVPLAYLVFSWFNLLIPMMAPIGAAMSCSFLAVLWQLGVQEKERRRMTKLFGSYLAPEVVNQMVELGINPEVGGEEIEITALFSDIEAFSALSEHLKPADLVELMCEYLTECTSAVHGTEGARGTLDKYVGDAIIAIYGAPIPYPKHAAAACTAALGIQKAQSALLQRWMEQGSRWPEAAHRMRTRIGLNTGLAVVGNIGSELRFNYTMMGDNVNLAQRIEASAAYFGVKILVSGTTYAEASQANPDFVFRHVDRILVPGRSQTVEVYELLGLRSEVSEKTLACCQAYEYALERYFQRDWAGAAASFRVSAEGEERHGKTNPSTVMLARCEGFLATPPAEDWNLASQLRKG